VVVAPVEKFCATAGPWPLQSYLIYFILDPEDEKLHSLGFFMLMQKEWDKTNMKESENDIEVEFRRGKKESNGARFWRFVSYLHVKLMPRGVRIRTSEDEPQTTGLFYSGNAQQGLYTQERNSAIGSR
jgi:hypothetical protein